MANPPLIAALVNPVTNLSRIDRWSVYHRLQELNINCWCAPDGSLWVEIENTLHAVLLRSVITQWTNSRRDLSEWLDRCWHFSS
jgi:hypothetical protein